MKRRSTVRVILALGFAIATSVILVQPAAAFRVLKDDGTQGYQEIDAYDMSGGPYGANCIYTGSGGELDRITVRPPTHVHGYYSGYTKVEWRFKVRREAPTSMHFNTVFTSGWQSDTANELYPADSFTRRVWYAPSNPTGYWQILLEVRWWHQGSIEGFLRGQYEWYKAKYHGMTYGNNEYCFSDYS